MIYSVKNFVAIFIALTFLTAPLHSCSAQEKPNQQIAQYVVETFEDSKGNLWFGTLEKGVAMYNGKTLKYFTVKDGLPSNRVTSIVEDKKGNLWFGTGLGLSKFDGSNFTNISKKEGLCSNMISRLFIDSKGVFWIGTWEGVCRFYNNSFSKFDIPYPKVKTPINQDTKNWITAINEDAEGNIWFARDGFGVCKFNGNTFTHILKKDGLYSNCVTEINFDKNNGIWFGMRVAEKDNPDPTKRKGKGGVNVYNGKAVKTFPEIKGFNTNDVYEIFKDTNNNLWLSTLENGVYKYDGTRFKNYNIPVSIMSITEDKKGNLWLGGAGGLFMIDVNQKIINMTIAKFNYF